MPHDDMIPAMKDLLRTVRESAHGSYSHRRGSKEAHDYADQLERGYGSDSDRRVRREIADLCAWLRIP